MWREWTAPRPFGHVGLVWISFASGVGTTVIRATGILPDGAGASWLDGQLLVDVIVVVVAVLSTAMAAALVISLARRTPPRWTDLSRWLLGVGWYSTTALLAIFVPLTVGNSLRGEAAFLRPVTAVVVLVTFALIAVTMNRSLFELRTKATPSAEALAFTVATQTLFALCALAMLLGMLEGRFGMLTNEVMLAGVTGLTVLGVPASIVTLVSLRRLTFTSVEEEVTAPRANEPNLRVADVEESRSRVATLAFDFGGRVASIRHAVGRRAGRAMKVARI